MLRTPNTYRGLTVSLKLHSLNHVPGMKACRIHVSHGIICAAYVTRWMDPLLWFCKILTATAYISDSRFIVAWQNQMDYKFVGDVCPLILSRSPLEVKSLESGPQLWNYILLQHQKSDSNPKWSCCSNIPQESLLILSSIKIIYSCDPSSEVCQSI
jgi:hypothetical protein